MYKREWIPKENTTVDSASKITIYDAGAFIYELLEINNQSPRLFCWEVLNREKGSTGRIIETIKSVPGEWIPFSLLHSETYPVILVESGYEISGWMIMNINQEVEAPKGQTDQKGPRPHRVQLRQKGPRPHRAQSRQKGPIDLEEALVLQVQEGEGRPQHQQQSKSVQQPSREQTQQLPSSQPKSKVVQPQGHPSSQKKGKRLGNSIQLSQDSSQIQRPSQYQAHLEAYLAPSLHQPA